MFEASFVLHSKSFLHHRSSYIAFSAFLIRAACLHCLALFLVIFKHSFFPPPLSLWFLPCHRILLGMPNNHALHILRSLWHEHVLWLGTYSVHVHILYFGAQECLSLSSCHVIASLLIWGSKWPPFFDKLLFLIHVFLWQRDKHKQGEGLVPPIVSFQSGGEVPRGQHCIISIHKMSWTTLVLWLACLLFYFCIWHWSPEDAGCNLSCMTPADIERAVTHV